MADIVFFGKENCINNKKQRELLTSSGHHVEFKNIQEEALDKEFLYLFFKDKPVEQWFNYTAPAIKSGAVNPSLLSSDAALEAMLEDRLLIKRPLLVINATYLSGFDTTSLSSLISLDPVSGQEQRVSQLLEDDLVTCPHTLDTNCDTGAENNG